MLVVVEVVLVQLILHLVKVVQVAVEKQQLVVLLRLEQMD